MLSWFLGKSKRSSAVKVNKVRYMRPRVQLQLEALEDRLVPANLVWNPTLLTGNSWETAAAWKDDATGVAPANAPGPGDDVYFYATSPALDCTLTNLSGACRSITVAKGWNHYITLQNGSLNVWGINGADSRIWDGCIAVVMAGAKGTLNILGGDFMYDTSQLNQPIVVPGGFQGNEDISIARGGKFDIGEDCLFVAANFEVGKDPGTNTDSPGTLMVDAFALGGPHIGIGTPVPTINVSSMGSLVLDTNAQLVNVIISSAGTVMLYSGSKLSTPNIQSISITGGYLNTSNIGVEMIDGNVTVDNATIRMGEASGLYSGLAISGNLNMQNTEMDFDVATDTPGTCDQIAVRGSVGIGTDCTAVYFNDGMYDPTYAHYYTPIYCESGNLTGQFAFVMQYLNPTPMPAPPPPPPPPQIPGMAPFPAPMPIPAVMQPAVPYAPNWQVAYNGYGFYLYG